MGWNVLFFFAFYKSAETLGPFLKFLRAPAATLYFDESPAFWPQVPGLQTVGTNRLFAIFGG